MLKKIYTAFLGLLFLSYAASGQSPATPVSYADPFIGSVNCRWFFFTPAALPFGMARLGPHTNAHYGDPSGWEPVGYDYRDHSIEGFGHFHEFQVGGIVLMPTNGKLVTVPGDTMKPYHGYRSSFDHASEKAMPGYYSVLLKDYGIRAELTATTHVGFHRYTFPAGKPSHIIIDVGNRQGESGRVLSAFVKKNGDYEIEGGVETLPEYVRHWDTAGSVKMYFVARFQHPIRHVGSFIHDSIQEGSIAAKGPGCGMYVTFDSLQQHTEVVRVGLSYISVDNARQNLNKEAGRLSFDQCRQQALSTWNDYLSRISVQGGTKEDKIKFYTGLYHALSGRGISNDVNGEYPQIGGGIGHIPLDKNGLPLYSHYNSDAAWGVCWNLQLLWGLAYPEVLNDFVRSHVDDYQNTGWLPDGVAAGALVPGMPSNFLGLMIASAYNRGIRRYDVQLAYEAARKNELEWRNRPTSVGKYDLKDFIAKGYIPIENTFQGFKFSASHTLEYAFSSWGVGQLAKALGKKEDYRQLDRMGLYYKNIFDTSIQMMRAKDSSGQFIKDFTPGQVWNGFQEGNSWQYSWYAPQDVQGLIRLMGKETFNTRLDSIFTSSAQNLFGGGKKVNSFAGLEAVYNQGNQPCLAIPYLFNYSGKPWLTQKWVREIIDVFYGTEPLHGYGYGQDEDQGQLGAWLAMSAIGLFDVQGGASVNPFYETGSPLFSKIIIHLDPDYYPGKTFTIEARHVSDENRYIQTATLNGKKLDKPWFYHSELVKGGKLTLVMGSKPNEQWGSASEDAPPSSYGDH